MKVAYKIYVSALEEKHSGYIHAAPIQCPEFESEQEAESWLKIKAIEAAPIVDNRHELKRYYFIQKTYIQ